MSISAQKFKKFIALHKIQNQNFHVILCSAIICSALATALLATVATVATVLLATVLLATVLFSPVAPVATVATKMRIATVATADTVDTTVKNFTAIICCEVATAATVAKFHQPNYTS